VRHTLSAKEVPVDRVALQKVVGAATILNALRAFRG
jgi:hypothetical protein